MQWQLSSPWQESPVGGISACIQFTRCEHDPTLKIFIALSGFLLAGALVAVAPARRTVGGATLVTEETIDS
jgi:hypothetical protein